MDDDHGRRPHDSHPATGHRFAHEKLIVSQTSLEFAAHTEQITSEAPQGRRDLLDQLRRSASSIVLNIAEGAGEFSRPEKARFYRMARRSATESAAALDLLRMAGLAADEKVLAARALLWEIVSMLTTMVRNLSGDHRREDRETDREDIRAGPGIVDSGERWEGASASLRQGEGEGEGKSEGEGKGEGFHG